MAKSRLVLGPARPPVQEIARWSGQDVKLTTHLNIVQMLRTHGAIPPLLHMSAWRYA
jgi:hypothetical protein